MKKIFLTALALFSCLLTFGQTLAPASSTVTSGDEIVITASGETSAAYFTSATPDNTLITSTSPDVFAPNYVSVQYIETMNTYNIVTHQPSAFKIKVTNARNIAYTIKLGFRTQIAGSSVSSVTIYITLTINPAVVTYYNQAQSAYFTKDNCGPGTEGSAVNYTIAAGTYSSTTSQNAANQLAINALNAGGQAYANTNGQCLTLYYNVAMSQSFIRNSCNPFYESSGVQYTYSVPAGKHSSTVSQAAADLKATNDLNINGQINANNLDVCIESRIGFRTRLRTNPYVSSGETLARVWLWTGADLSTVSLDYYSQSGIFVYTGQYGTTPAAAGYYTDLYSDPTDGAYTRVFQVGPNGELVSYTMVPIP